MNTIKNSHDMFSSICFKNVLAYKHISTIDEDIEVLDLLDCTDFMAGSLIFDTEWDGSSCRLNYNSNFNSNYPWDNESFQVVLVIDWVINWENVQKLCAVCEPDFKKVAKGLPKPQDVQ